MILDFLLENSFLLVFWLGISELFFLEIKLLPSLCAIGSFE